MMGWAKSQTPHSNVLDLSRDHDPDRLEKAKTPLNTTRKAISTIQYIHLIDIIKVGCHST
jgi:hypothetical protein